MPLIDSSSELQTHCCVADLLRFTARPNVIWTHFPAGESRSPRTGAKLKRMGVRRGVADFLIVTPDGKARFLEIKSAKGQQSIEQRGFELQCESSNIPYRIARSLKEAQTILTEWGALKTGRQEQSRRAA